MAESPALAPLFTAARATTIAWLIIGYGFVASVLPVWMLLCPRDYLSTFVKIGTILLLAVGILVVLPPLKLPALTRFIDGSGPVFAGQALSLRVHHHRLRRHQRVPRAGGQRHDAQDAPPRERRAA